MKIIGIIIEANPLHNGHLHLINQIKEKERPDCLIAVVSTYFSMRGDISCYSKVDKVTNLLEVGFDLVFELPTYLAVERADIFAKNAIDILRALNITHLAFGMEDDNLTFINQVLDAYQSPIYQKAFKDFLAQKNSYKKAHVLALKPFFTTEEWNIINNSNFSLGLEYLKIIKDTTISPIMIKRIGPKYDDFVEREGIASATYLRHLIKEKQDVDKYLPRKPHEMIDLNKAEQNFFSFFKYITQVRPNSLVKNSINTYLIKNTNNCQNYQQLVNELTTDKFTKTRIKRTILKNLLGFDEIKKASNNQPSYLRMLGTNQNGLSYLHILPKETKQLIFSRPNNIDDVNPILEYELLAAKFYDLICETDYFLSEYQFPIRKE